MEISPSLGITPLNDCVLVELIQSRKNVTTKEGKYDSRTEGIVLATPKMGLTGKQSFDDVRALFGKHIYFEEFKEGARIHRNGKIYGLIKIDDLRGVEDVEPETKPEEPGVEQPN